MAMNESTFDIQAQLIGNSMDSGSLSSYQQIKIKSEVIAIHSDKLANGSHNGAADAGHANGFEDFAQHFRGVDPNLLGDGTRDLDEIEEEDDYIPIESAIEPMKIDPPKEEPQPEPQAGVKEPEPETKVEQITPVSVQSPQPKPDPELSPSSAHSCKKHLELEPTVVVPIVEVHYTSKDPVSERLEFCLVCGSTGDSTNLIYCHDCGESYHTFCLTPKVVVENLSSVAEWRCPHCKFCEQCLEMSEEDKLIMCDKCDRCFHIFCLDPPLQQVPNESWRCSHCIKCDRCGTRTPGEGPEAKWTHSYTLCWTCGNEYDKKLAEIKLDLIEQSKNKPPVPPPLPITTIVKINKQEAESGIIPEPVKQAPILTFEEKTEMVDIVTPPITAPLTNSIKEEPQQERQVDASPDSYEDDDLDSEAPPSYNSDGDNNLLPEDEEEMKEDFEVMSDDKMDIEETSLSGIEDYDMSDEDKAKRSNGAYSFKDAAFMVLKKAGKPLSVNKITEICIKEGYITTEGKTPERTMGSNLYCEINKYGDKARFKKLGKGIFTVSPYAEKHLLNRRSVKKKKEASPMKPQPPPSSVHPATRSSRRTLTTSINGDKPERPISPAPSAAVPPVVEKKPVVAQEATNEAAPTASASQEVPAAVPVAAQAEARPQTTRTAEANNVYYDREKHSMEDDAFVDISEESSDRSLPINIPNGYSSTTMYNGHSTSEYPANTSVRAVTSIFDDEANHNQVPSYHAHRQSMHHDEDDLFGHKQSMPMRTMDTFPAFEMHDMYSGAPDMHDYLSHRASDPDTSLLAMYPSSGYNAGFHNQAPEAFAPKYTMPYESHVPSVQSTSVFNHKADMMSNFGMNRTSDLNHMDFFDGPAAFGSRPIIQQVARQSNFSNSPKLGPSHIGFEHMPHSPHHSSPPDSILKPTGFSDPGFFKNTNSPSLNPIDPFTPKSPFHSPEGTPGVMSPMQQSPPTQLPMLNSYQNGQTQILSPTPTKRGRGRPRKYPPSETPTPPPPEGDTPKRGRGRPPKNRSGTPQPGQTSQSPPPSLSGTPIPQGIPSASPSPLLEGDPSPVPLIIPDDMASHSHDLLLSLTTLTTPTTLVDVSSLGPPEMMSNATLETLQAKRGRGRPRKYPIGEPRPPRPPTERNSRSEPTEPRRIVTRPRKIPKSEDFIFEYQSTENAAHDDDKMTASSVDEDPEFKGPRPLAASSSSAASEAALIKRGRGRPPKLRDSFGTPILSRSFGDGSLKRPVGRPKKGLHFFGQNKLIRGTADYFNSAQFEINESTPLTLNTISRLEAGPALNKVWNYKKTLDLSAESSTVTEQKAQKEDVEVNCLNVVMLDKHVHPHTRDTRKCALCKEEGDLAVRGRLLFLTTYTWVHSNCASWSSEVFESEEGDLINIWKALHRAKTTVCDLCRGVGATVSCNSVRCSKNFHFNCAVKANCKFSISPEDKFVNCEAHAPVSIVKSETKDPANPNRVIHGVLKSSFTQNKKLVPQKVNLLSKKSKLAPQIPAQDVMARVGALSVRNLGQIVHNKKTFSNADYIFPLHYTSSRIYWSWKLERDDDVVRRRNIRVGRKLRKKPPHRDMIRLPKLFLPRCLYRMQIFEIDGEPCFKITCEDDPDVLIVGKTAADAWRQVIEKINSAIFTLYKELLSNIELYKKMDVEPLSRLLLIRNNLRSEYFFGLGSPTVTKMIEKLPNARLCRAYNFQYDMIIRIPRTILHSVLYNREIKTELPVNPSGCARTEPYAKKNNDEKMEYMGAYGFQALHNKLVPSLAGRKINNSTRDDYKHADSIKELPVGVLYRQMRQKLSKTIQVMRSPIHEWGVFAKQEIKENDMIIEYVGEEIRQKMADLRETRYNSKGIGCYMFKIDEDVIVDATEKGNIARFINHCCDPNAYTRIVAVEGRKKIIIFAKKDIKPGEEIAYDYMFPIEDEKVPCRCGAASCRGTMN